MSLSAIPQQIILQTGNGQNLLSWNIIAGVTGYSVQRSTDGVNFSVIASPTTNYYVDSGVSVGTVYYYRVASVSVSGISGYAPCFPNSIVPCAPGQINLGYLRYQARLRADNLKSNFCTNDEWNFMINNSINELKDLLTCKFGEDYFLAAPLIIQSTSALSYPLPNGTNYLQTGGIPDPNGTFAPACFKVYGMDFNSFGAQINNTQGWVSMSRFNWADHNKYNILLGAASNNVSGQYCSFQYREMGDQVYIIPTNSGQYFRLWYVPLSPQLLLDTDMMPFGYSAWWEYPVVDAASKALAKQQLFDQSQELLNRKSALEVRIEVSAANRNVGQPNTATNSRNTMGDPNFSGPGGNYGGGFGGGMGGGYGYAALIPGLLFPYLFQNYFRNQVLNYSVFISDVLLTILTCGILFSYLSHLSPGKLSRWISFSRRAASFFNFIPIVIQNGAKK